TPSRSRCSRSPTSVPACSPTAPRPTCCWATSTRASPATRRRSVCSPAITAAVAGYRTALGLLSADHMMFGSGSTTLWGLAVALDRSGDLDSGLESVRVARSYDAQDKHLNGPGWFYLPAYDRHWYEALGHWQVARKGEAV